MGEARRRQQAMQQRAQEIQKLHIGIIDASNEQRCRAALDAVNAITGLNTADHLMIAALLAAGAIALRPPAHRATLLDALASLAADRLEQIDALPAGQA